MNTKKLIGFDVCPDCEGIGIIKTNTADLIALLVQVMVMLLLIKKDIILIIQILNKLQK